MKKIIIILIVFTLPLSLLAQSGSSGSKYVHFSKRKSIDKIPEVETMRLKIDTEIPVNKKKYNKRIALVIGNENYSNFQDGGSNIDVIYALNDAKVFSRYCEKTLGCKKDNIFLLKDATSAQMNSAIIKIRELMKIMGENVEVIFYYAGHGLPDEEGKESYIIPVDVVGQYLPAAIKLSFLYEQLAINKSKKITVFLDACFSGGAREQGLIAARGIRHTTKSSYMKGNIVVFSASSGTQSSLPWREKQHGMFTYFLLKKINETKGRITYEDLSKYVKEEVQIKSWKINNKAQSPNVLCSPKISQTWKEIKLYK